MQLALCLCLSFCLCFSPTHAEPAHAFGEVPRSGTCGGRTTLTGVVTWTMAYDPATGGIASVTDAHGLATTVERAVDGTPTAIVGPYGHRTELTLGADGWIETTPGRRRSGPTGS